MNKFKVMFKMTSLKKFLTILIFNEFKANLEKINLEFYRVNNNREFLIAPTILLVTQL